MALFTRTGPDRFNILIRFYGLNIGPSAGLFTSHRRERAERRGPPRVTDTAIRHVSLPKYPAYLWLLCPHCSSPACLYLPPPPPSTSFSTHLSSAHNSNEKTRPWSRQCKSNRGEIDGSNDSGLVLRGDSCSRQLRAIGLEIDESEDTARKLCKLFPASAILCRYFPRVQGSDY